MTGDPFAISASKYATTIFHLYLKKYWWIYLLPVLMCVVLTTVNINFIYVALCVIFIGMPMAMTFVYFAYCLNQDIALSIMPKVMTLSDDGLQLAFEKGVKIIAYKEIKSIRYGKECIMLNLPRGKFSFFMIPYAIFDNVDELQSFIEQIKERLKSA